MSEEKNINKMELIEYKIGRYGNNPNIGVLIGDGQQWLVTKDNVVDYVLDGIKFINKNYIRHQKTIEYDTMKSQVINLKYITAHKDQEYIKGFNLDDFYEFFCNIMASGKLVEIGLEKSDSIFVGTIHKVHEKSFIVQTIGSNTEDCGKMRIPFFRVRYVGLDTDYLKSLELYLKKG